MKFKAKNGHNPVGYGRFLTQKFNKKTIFRTILPYLAVAKYKMGFCTYSVKKPISVCI